jgi:hypothetical protein
LNRKIRLQHNPWKTKAAGEVVAAQSNVLTGRKNPQAVALRACRTFALYCTAPTAEIGAETMSAHRSRQRGFFSFRTKPHRRPQRHPAGTRRAVVEQLEKRDLLAVVVPDSVISIGGTLNDAGRTVAVDTAGNYYLAGGFRDTVDFDLGPGTTNLTSNGNRDIFVAKYFADGTLDWARSFGGPGSDYEWFDWLDGDIQVDASGNTYVLCDFWSTVTFGGDATFGDVNEFTFTSDITTDHVMLRFDSGGKLEWATWFGGAEVGGFVLDVDGNDNGNIYAAGAFTGTRTFGTQQLTAISAKIGGNSYNQDGFLSRLDADTGAFTWTKKTSGKGNEVFTSIAFDPSGSGSLYLPGYHRNEAVFGGSSTFPLIKGTKGIANEGFVAKADLAGNFNWAKVIAKGDTEALGATMVNGNVIVTGSFGGTQVAFGNIQLTNAQSNSDVYVARMDASGNILWAVNAGGVAGSTTQLRPLDITSDAFGNVFVSGLFTTGSGSASAQFGSEILTSIGTGDHFISQLNGANGQLLESWRMGGPLAESNVGGLTVDAAGNLWMTGQFYGAADFPDGTTLTSNSASGDIFVLRFLQSPPLAMSASVFGGDAIEVESIPSRTLIDSPEPTANSVTATTSPLTLALTTNGASTKAKRHKVDDSQRVSDADFKSVDAAMEEIDYSNWQQIIAEIALAG